jgi:arginine kinase
MGGCASKDKKQKVVESGNPDESGGEGCVSNSMVFLSRCDTAKSLFGFFI